jgi:hypothetical protein
VKKEKLFTSTMSKFMLFFFLLVGSIFLVLSAFVEHDVSSRPSTFGVDRLGELCFDVSDLVRTASAGSSKIFAGLCFVAVAILFSAGARRTGMESPVAERVVTAD